LEDCLASEGASGPAQGACLEAIQSTASEIGFWAGGEASGGQRSIECGMFGGLPGQRAIQTTGEMTAGDFTITSHDGWYGAVVIPDAFQGELKGIILQNVLLFVWS